MRFREVGFEVLGVRFGVSMSSPWAFRFRMNPVKSLPVHSAPQRVSWRGSCPRGDAWRGTPLPVREFSVAPAVMWVAKSPEPDHLMPLPHCLKIWGFTTNRGTPFSPLGGYPCYRKPPCGTVFGRACKLHVQAFDSALPCCGGCALEFLPCPLRPQTIYHKIPQLDIT